MGTRQELARLASEVRHVKDDVGELKTDLRKHQQQHNREREETDRRSTATRRFRVAAGAAWVASVTGVIALLVDISSKIR